MGYKDRCSIEELRGKVITRIEGGVGSDELRFYCDDGSQYVMYHDQDCCESVSIEDIAGSFEDLIGSPVTIAHEDTNKDAPKTEDYDESHTWTFYNLATNRGSVTIRWYGTSNGYYSEGVDFERVNAPRT